MNAKETCFAKRLQLASSCPQVSLNAARSFRASRDRNDQPIEQDFWVAAALEVLGTLFGGATAYPKGRGVWRDDEQGGKLLFDEPVVIQSYTTEQTIKNQAKPLREFLMRLGTECRQGAVGFVIDRDYLEIPFPSGGK